MGPRKKNPASELLTQKPEIFSEKKDTGSEFLGKIVTQEIV